MNQHRRVLNPGDHVQLNGKGPVMTVIKYIAEGGITDDAHSRYIVKCHWYDEEGEKSAEYHQLHLVKVDKPSKGDQAHIKVGHDKLIEPNDPTPGKT